MECLDPVDVLADVLAGHRSAQILIPLRCPAVERVRISELPDLELHLFIGCPDRQLLSFPKGGRTVLEGDLSLAFADLNQSPILGHEHPVAALGRRSDSGPWGLDVDVRGTVRPLAVECSSAKDAHSESHLPELHKLHLGVACNTDDIPGVQLHLRARCVRRADRVALDEGEIHGCGDPIAGVPSECGNVTAESADPGHTQRGLRCFVGDGG